MIYEVYLQIIINNNLEKKKKMLPKHCSFIVVVLDTYHIN